MAQPWGLLETMPSTNARIAVCLVLEILYVLTLLVALVVGRPLQMEVVYTIGAFVTGLSGIGAAQFKFKRETFDPNAPDGAAKPMAAETDGTAPSGFAIADVGARIVPSTSSASARGGKGEA